MFEKEDGIINVDNVIYFDILTSTLHFKMPNNNKENRLIVNKKLLKIQEEEKNKALCKKPKKITELNISPTDSCLGNCVYCYNSNNNTASNSLSLETLEKLLINNENFIFDNINKIRFFGGEPFLNREIFSFIRYLKKRFNPEIYISSGLIFNDALFELIIKNKRIFNGDVTIGVSIDFGVPKDSYTRKSDLENINKAVLYRRLLKLEANNIKVYWISNISSLTNFDLFVKETDDLLKFKNERKVRISVITHDYYTPSAALINKVSNYIKTKTNVIYTNVFNYSDFYKTTKIKRLSEDTFLFIRPINYCGIYTSMIEINPNGTYGHCHMDMNTEYDLEKYKHLLFDKKCDNCEYNLICRNGCACRKKYLKSEINNDIYCYWFKLSFQNVLYNLVKTCNGKVDLIKSFLEKESVNK